MTPLPPLGTPVCLLSDLPDGGARLFAVAGIEPPLPLLVLRSGDTVSGYLNRCAHFGVPLAGNEAQLIHTPHREIKCNVHYARYAWEDGRCLGGECAGEGLTPVPLAVVDGVIRIR